MRGHEDLARLLLEDPEADRCEMGERLFEELTSLRELSERQELERAKRALEEKDRQKDQSIAVIAHELRNPLAAIRLVTDAMGLMQIPDPRALGWWRVWIAKSLPWLGCWTICRMSLLLL